MTIVNKIRKRIKTLQSITKETITEIPITKQEAKELDYIKEIDNVKLKVVDKISYITRTDCFAYINKNGHESCYSLNKIYCQKEVCPFYNNKLKIEDIEKEIKQYKKIEENKSKW